MVPSLDGSCLQAKQKKVGSIYTNTLSEQYQEFRESSTCLHLPFTLFSPILETSMTPIHTYRACAHHKGWKWWVIYLSVIYQVLPNTSATNSVLYSSVIVSCIPSTDYWKCSWSSSLNVLRTGPLFSMPSWYTRHWPWISWYLWHALWPGGNVKVLLPELVLLDPWLALHCVGSHDTLKLCQAQLDFVLVWVDSFRFWTILLSVLLCFFVAHT